MLGPEQAVEQLIKLLAIICHHAVLGGATEDKVVAVTASLTRKTYKAVKERQNG
jgi:hypothetical protein